jgi:single-strand DNA-binding protein
LKKGGKLYLEGRLQYRNYDDKNGVKRSVTEIVMDEMVMLDSRGAGSGAGSGATTPSGGDAPSQDEPGGKIDDLPF